MLQRVARVFCTSVASFVVLAVSAACGGGGDSPTGPSASIAGTYSLSSVNGSAPPVILFTEGTYTLRVTSGNFVVNTNNTFSATTTYQETEAGQTSSTTETCTGTYTRNSNSLAFSEAESGETCGADYNGTWNGSNSLTVAYDATIQAVYTR